jgi:hypothetical protein
MSLPDKGRVERRGKVAVITPYSGMAIAELMVLKRASETYAPALLRIGQTDFRTWAHLIERWIKQPFTSCHWHSHSEKTAALSLAGQLVAIYDKFEGARHG